MTLEKNRLIGYALAIAAFLLVRAEVLAGIRIDGTEFQSASSVLTTNTGTKSAPDGVARSNSQTIVLTCGQAVMAHGRLVTEANTAVEIGLGYEYNVLVTSPFGCGCPHQGDFDVTGVADPIDLSALVDIVFFSANNPQDPFCPAFRGDLNCDGETNVLDLVWSIDYHFFSGPGPCNPCAS